MLNFPIRLNNKLASIAGTVGTGDNRPTYQAEQVAQELTQQTDVELAKLRRALRGPAEAQTSGRQEEGSGRVRRWQAAREVIAAAGRESCFAPAPCFGHIDEWHLQFRNLHGVGKDRPAGLFV